ncbi:hypothetical protein C789_377 [Microcystis aeruginosa FACHB-905 = DIANCHI905]|nr:hypothetical protein C789_377 [Microcystis aeruginosa FACHB-905 = DIANCHI905]
MHEEKTGFSEKPVFCALLSDRGKIFPNWSSQKIPVRVKLIIDRLCEESDPHDQ